MLILDVRGLLKASGERIPDSVLVSLNDLPGSPGLG